MGRRSQQRAIELARADVARLLEINIASDEVLAALEHYVSVAPADPLARTAHSRSLLAAGQFEMAEAQARNALKLADGEPVALISVADVLCDLGSLQEAGEVLEAAAERMDRDDPAIVSHWLCTHAMIRRRNEEPEFAEELLVEAITLDPENIDARRELDRLRRGDRFDPD